MEPDRFKNNHFLYIFGLISLIAAITLFFFSLYIIPYLLWNFKYHVPDVVLYLIALFDETYDYTNTQARLLAWLFFFIPCLIFGFCSYFASNRIENQIHHVDTPEQEKEEPDTTEELKEEIKESASIGFKIIALMVLIVIVIVLLQVFFQFTS